MTHRRVYYYLNEPSFWLAIIGLVSLALLLVGCGGAAESMPAVYVAANSMTKHHADASHPYGEHPSSQVRAASRDLQEVRDRCRWADTGSAWLACGQPHDMDERRALERLDEALAAARRR